jgi:two-component system, chemotaxis family, protein-glutamate methylesterase/glutaminase
VVVSTAGADSFDGIEALQLGAVDVVGKPTSLSSEELYGIAGELVQKVRAAAVARLPSVLPSPPPPIVEAPITTKRRVVVIGTSTGGPHAITRVLSALPANFPVPILIALHIPSGYTEALATRLDQLCAIDVKEASDNLELRPGLAILARGGMHLKVERVDGSARARVSFDPPGAQHWPSVDVLFESAAREFGSGVVGVVLTGMGSDGLIGARAIRDAGGAVLTESESSCVVFGMPRSVKEAGLSTSEAPIERIAEALLREL